MPPNVPPVLRRSSRTSRPSSPSRSGTTVAAGVGAAPAPSAGRSATRGAPSSSAENNRSAAARRGPRSPLGSGGGAPAGGADAARVRRHDPHAAGPAAPARADPRRGARRAARAGTPSRSATTWASHWAGPVSRRRSPTRTVRHPARIGARVVLESMTHTPLGPITRWSMLARLPGTRQVVLAPPIAGRQPVQERPRWPPRRRRRAASARGPARGRTTQAGDAGRRRRTRTDRAGRPTDERRPPTPDRRRPPADQRHDRGGAPAPLRPSDRVALPRARYRPGCAPSEAKPHPWYSSHLSGLLDACEWLPSATPIWAGPTIPSPPRAGVNQREWDFERSFEAAVDLALAQEPDLVIWLGDIFDHPRPDLPLVPGGPAGAGPDPGARRPGGGHQRQPRHAAPAGHRQPVLGPGRHASRRCTSPTAWPTSASSCPAWSSTPCPQMLTRRGRPGRAGRGGPAPQRRPPPTCCITHPRLTQLQPRHADINEIEVDAGRLQSDLVLLGHYHTFARVTERDVVRRVDRHVQLRRRPRPGQGHRGARHRHRRVPARAAGRAAGRW